MLLCRGKGERNNVNNRRKTETFLLRGCKGTNGWLKERCTSEYMPTVSAGLSVIFFLLQRIGREVAVQKTLDFSEINDHLTQGFPRVFYRLFQPPKEQQLGKNNFLSADNDFSPVRRYIFRRRNL